MAFATPKNYDFPTQTIVRRSALWSHGHGQMDHDWQAKRLGLCLFIFWCF